MTTNTQVNNAISSTVIASAIAKWDTNKNMSANSLITGFTTTATAASTTTLTVASTWQQFFTGTTTQTVVLPVTSTLVAGQSFYIVNSSTGVVTVQSSGANTIQAMAANTTLLVTCILTSGTTAASWAVEYVGAVSGGTVNAGLINQLAWYSGSGTAVSGLTTANNGVLVTSAGGVPSISSTLPSDLTIPTPYINGIVDTNNNEMIGFSSTASAVNSVQISNGATAGSPNIVTIGSDTNITLTVKGKGTGGVQLAGITSGAAPTAGYVNELITSTVTFSGATSFTTGNITTVTSISVPAGRWLLFGNNGLTGTTVTAYQGGMSTANNSLPAAELTAIVTPLATGANIIQTLPSQIINISSTTVYYSVVFGTGTGTLKMFGNISALRIG